MTLILTVFSKNSPNLVEAQLLPEISDPVKTHHTKNQPIVFDDEISAGKVTANWTVSSDFHKRKLTAIVFVSILYNNQLVMSEKKLYF